LEEILAAKNAEGAKGKGEKSHAKSAKSAKVGSRVLREEISDDEKPFEIPESWEWVRLGEIGSWSAGATPSRTRPDYYGGNIPWLKTGDLNDGYVTEIPETITELALAKTSVRLNPVGSVLMAMYGATIGKLGILQVAATTNQACCACIPCSEIYNKYLFYFLKGYRKSFIKMGEGGAQPNISKEKIVRTLFPLPPLAEQKRIVAKIEELLPLVERYEKAWSKLKDFNKRFPADMQKSLLQMAIQGKLVEQRAEEGTGKELLEKILAAKGAKKAGVKSHAKSAKSAKAGSRVLREEIPDDEKPFDIPESWEWYRIGDLFNIVNGFTPLKSNREFWSNGDIPWFTIEDVRRQGRFIYSTEKFITQKALTKNTERVVPPDTVLLCCTASVGEYAYTKIPLTTNQQFNAFVVKKDYQNYIYPLYVFEYVKTLKNNLIDRAGKTTFNFVSVGKLSKMLIPLPPLAEQKRIVAKLEELLPLCERLK
jgi:type I restriction enzyme S subunit